jgi:hypothetical protein
VNQQVNWDLITVVNATCIAAVIWIDLGDDNHSRRGPSWSFWMLVIVNMLCCIAIVGEQWLVSKGW